ncbi:forkhead protein/ forkhead protein domain [Schistosoma japonicum]|nr:forkhead protein/ forkhead protein domain [Schistosoma japonicum]
MSLEIINTVDKLKLSDQIEQEKISLNLLRQANCKLEESIDILEDQLTSIEDEDNEWKTRYLIQKEMNDYYKRAFFFCDQQIPKAKAIQRTINRAAYYWATEIRKRALIELNYTYIPAPVSKHPVEKKEDEGDRLVKKTQNRTFNSKYGLGSKTSGVKKLPPMHF